MPARILLIGTADTKSAELDYIRQQIAQAGARTLLLDVGVVGEASCPVDIDKHAVFAAAGTNLEKLLSLADENQAMTLVAKGATTIAVDLQKKNEIDGVLIIGGTMGTDLALDVAGALPLGFPKIIISTIAFSHLIPPDRLAPDLIMMLWSGGLYGLNSICQSALAQVSGAIVGVCQSVKKTDSVQPRVGMTSFGSSAAKWMLRLVPGLEALGYEAIVFHATGMGGRAYEALARSSHFSAVMDFAIQEVSNHEYDSPVSAGPDRLCGAEAGGVPQLIAPGFLDLVDLPAWQAIPTKLLGQPRHDHNRLITSVVLNAEQRTQVVKTIAEKLNQNKTKTVFILPTHGIHEWDRSGEPLCDPVAIDAVNRAVRKYLKPPVELVELDCHINDELFSTRALEIFTQWHQEGLLGKA